MASYIVVFQYNAKAGAYEGNRYILHYRDRDDYSDRCTAKWLIDNKVKVVEHGVTESRAHQLCEEVSPLRKAEATLAEYGGDAGLAKLALAVELKS